MALPRPFTFHLLRSGFNPVERLLAVLLLQRVHDLPHARQSPFRGPRAAVIDAVSPQHNKDIIFDDVILKRQLLPVQVQLQGELMSEDKKSPQGR